MQENRKLSIYRYLINNKKKRKLRFYILIYFNQYIRKMHEYKRNKYRYYTDYINKKRTYKIPINCFFGRKKRLKNQLFRNISRKRIVFTMRSFNNIGVQKYDTLRHWNADMGITESSI